MSTTTPDVTCDAAAVEATAFRLLGGLVAAMELLTAHLGRELGWYAALAGSPLTPRELADRTGTAERYAREWCEQQAVAGFLTVDRNGPLPRYSAPAATVAVLVERDSPAFLGAATAMLTGIGEPVEALLEACRTGRGVPYDAYGESGRLIQGEFNRPAFLHDLPRWMAAMPDVEARLREEGARALDVGCGVGWGAIGLALAYPGLRVDGIDADSASIAAARRNAAESGVADRVRFEVTDAADAGPGGYDLVLAVEVVHDLARPVEALAAMRDRVANSGAVLAVDPRWEDPGDGPADELQRMLRASSVLLCLPRGMDHDHPVGTGAAMTAETFAGYAGSAGFRGVEELDVPHPMWVFRRLR